MNKPFKEGLPIAIISLCVHALVISWFFSRQYFGLPALQNEKVLQVQMEASAGMPAVSSVDPMGVEAGIISGLERGADPVIPSAGISSDNMTEAGAVLPFGEPSAAARERTYLPASIMDVRPAASTPVVVPFPDAQLGKRKGSAILVLFIDTDGKINHIEIESSDLPPVFEKTAIDTFKQAQMSPGMKGGIPVKTKMKIVVEFEAK